MDIGLQRGGGVLIDGKVFIEARYGLGLTDLSDDVTAKNRVIQFTVHLPLSFNQWPARRDANGFERKRGW